MAGVNGRDLALTGLPRGGTTLACRLLGQCRGAVALFEPIETMALGPARELALQQVQSFVHDARARLLSEGVAPSKQRDGQVPDNPFGPADAHGERPLLATPGLLRPAARPRPGFTLVLKHNAAFAALLPELAERMPTLAIVRHPLAVLASWQTVPLPVRAGRVPVGERLDPRLAEQLEAEPVVLRRQLRVLEWFFARYDQHLPDASVLRYEDLVASQGALLFERAALAGAPAEPLQERNASRQYPSVQVAELAEALLATGGPWERWYPRAQVAALAQRLTTAPAAP